MLGDHAAQARMGVDEAALSERDEQMVLCGAGAGEEDIASLKSAGGGMEGVCFGKNKPRVDGAIAQPIALRKAHLAAAERKRCTDEADTVEACRRIATMQAEADAL